MKLKDKKSKGQSHRVRLLFGVYGEEGRGGEIGCQDVFCVCRFFGLSTPFALVDDFYMANREHNIAKKSSSHVSYWDEDSMFLQHHSRIDKYLLGHACISIMKVVYVIDFHVPASCQLLNPRSFFRCYWQLQLPSLLCHSSTTVISSFICLHISPALLINKPYHQTSHHVAFIQSHLRPGQSS